jgi:L,D-peptidoglycan transpeptidase YkuD (ErfK/YbiS/YcfS/YnhG family)
MLTLALALALHGCPQRIVVTAPSARATTASLSLLECGNRVAGPYPARVGYHGLTAHRREGDGTTPLGTFAVGRIVFGLDANPGLRLPYHRLRCGDWWDGDPASSTYNSFRHVACGATPPFKGASEALWQNRIAYREFAFIAYNADPALPGLGSAIFLHDDTGRATNGCVSLPRSELIHVLRRLGVGATITIRLNNSR